ncbi:MAG: hypothetical protein ACMXYE_00990 [Candidatus Woesearchaeota archaeon]
MNKKQYATFNKNTTAWFNEKLQEYCVQNPEHRRGIQSYISKIQSLNRPQFVAGFQAKDSTKDFTPYWKVPVLLESVMLKAYYANNILDSKNNIWNSTYNIETRAFHTPKEKVNENIANEWYVDSYLNKLSLDILQDLNPEEALFVQKAYFTIGEKISQGLKIEREALSINHSDLETISNNFEQNYTNRCIFYDKVYDYVPLVAFGLANKDYGVVERYDKNVLDQDKFSGNLQIINDLGDFCTGKNSFSDIRSGVVTLPTYALQKSSVILEGLFSPQFTQFPRWQKEVRDLLKKEKIVHQIEEKTLQAHRVNVNFWKELGANTSVIECAYGMLQNNKYFEELR